MDELAKALADQRDERERRAAAIDALDHDARVAREQANAERERLHQQELQCGADEAHAAQERQHQSASLRASESRAQTGRLPAAGPDYLRRREHHPISPTEGNQTVNGTNANDPVAYNAFLFAQHMNAARLLEEKNTEDAAKRPTPEPKREAKRGLL